jgi:hypothetical protein
MEWGLVIAIAEALTYLVWGIAGRVMRDEYRVGE